MSFSHRDILKIIKDKNISVVLAKLVYSVDYRLQVESSQFNKRTQEKEGTRTVQQNG
jgi:hypothetical protein